MECEQGKGITQLGIVLLELSTLYVAVIRSS